jgi:hypothetical protein
MNAPTSPVTSSSHSDARFSPQMPGKSGEAVSLLCQGRSDCVQFTHVASLPSEGQWANDDTVTQTDTARRFEREFMP